MSCRGERDCHAALVQQSTHGLRFGLERPIRGGIRLRVIAGIEFRLRQLRLNLGVARKRLREAPRVGCHFGRALLRYAAKRAHVNRHHRSSAGTQRLDLDLANWQLIAGQREVAHLALHVVPVQLAIQRLQVAEGRLARLDTRRAGVDRGEIFLSCPERSLLKNR